MKINIRTTFLLSAVSFLFFVLTYPALSGSFELDDYGNLIGLERIKDFISAFYFSFNGLSSRLGRPVSLITFALQANSWPNPYYFKVFNLCLHLVNAILVFILFKQLIKPLVSKTQQKIYSWSLYGFWILAPIHMFSTFYVIQRMTLLSSFFILLALCIHVYIRQNGFKSSVNKSYLLITVSFLVFLLLAVLSKENGILLCVYILVIELTLLNNNTMPRYWSFWKLIFLFGPILLLVIYLGSSGRIIYETIEIYGVDWYQRLLNESLILFEYIRIILLPEYGAYGLINDDYFPIHSIADNYSSLYSILVIIILLAWSFLFRKKYAIPAFAILWFFGGHLLESTTVPLELYFEHRNYLPSLGVLIILIYSIERMINSVDSKPIKNLILIAIVAYSILYGYVLRSTAISWSSSYELAFYQIKFHPDSLRAQTAYVSYLYHSGQMDEALKLMTYIGLQNPLLIGHQLQLQMLSCIDKRFSVKDEERFYSVLKKGKFDYSIDSSISQIFDYKVKGQCPAISYAQLNQFIIALQENVTVSKHLWEILAVYKSKVYASEAKWKLALQALEETPEKRKKDINFYFLKLKYQYMLEDREGADDTINVIDEWFRKSPKDKYTHSGALNVFKLNLDKIQTN